MTTPRPESLIAIDREMARQHADAIASFEQNRDVAARAAASLKKTGRLLMLGMGGSHAVAPRGGTLLPRPRHRRRFASVSEQLAAPLPIKDRTIFVTSQSGESVEVVRWFKETGDTPTHSR